MKTVSFIGEHGRVLAVFAGATDALEGARPPACQMVVDGAPPSPRSYWTDSSWHEMPAPVHPALVWDWQSHAWTDPRTPERAAVEAWAAIRAHRDKLLAESDWRVVMAAERGEALQPEWATYRQALRDITKQADPSAITWPELPSTF